MINFTAFLLAKIL